MSNENKILLVEDDTFLIDILVQKFKSGGYTVVHAGDGETALKKVHEESPDLIFLDIILPGMNGFEVLKKLKDDDTIGDIPVAFLSNLGQKEDIEKGKRLGAVDFIVKANHSLDEIVKKAGEILDSNPNGSTGGDSSSGSGDTQTGEKQQQSQPTQQESGSGESKTLAEQVNSESNATTANSTKAKDDSDSTTGAAPEAPSPQ